MADKNNDIIEKIRDLIGNEAAEVAKQHQELTAKLEKAKADLAKTEQKNADASAAADQQVSGLTTRLADVERREHEVTSREDAVTAREGHAEMTAHGLGLREQALVPQEEDYRRRLTELTGREQQVLTDATELAQLRDELLKQAETQQVKEEALNTTKEALKAAEAEILKQQQG